MSSDNGQAWQHRARCRNLGIDLFFPIGTKGTDYLNDLVEDAVRYCRRCPVKAQCLEWALESGEGHGIWGGVRLDDLSPRQRKETRDQFRRKRAS